MGNVKMETNGMCQTCKSYIVASLISKGLPFQSTDWSKVHHFKLVLSDPEVHNRITQERYRSSSP